MSYSFIIHSWMISELKLSGNELILYANIYQFSSIKGNYFSASLSTISEELNISVNTIQRILKKLVENDLIKKEELLINNVKVCRYCANLNNINNTNNNEGIAKMAKGYSQNGYQENNNINNKYNNINNTNNTNTNNQVIRRGTLFDAEKKSENKAKKYARMVKMTKSFLLNFNRFSNNDLKDIERNLLDYLAVRVKRGLEPEQWSKILEPLLLLNYSAYELKTKIVTATAAGYAVLVPSWELDKLNKPIDNITEEPDDDIDYTPSGVAF